MRTKRFGLMLDENTELTEKTNGEFSSIAEAMLSLALQNPHRPAFCKLSGDASKVQQWFSWGQIAKWVYDACDAIDSEYLPLGSHLATVICNSVEWFVLDFACQTLGYVHVGIDHHWPDVMIGKLLEQSQAQLVFGLHGSTSTHFQSQENVPRLNWQLDCNAPCIGKAELSKLHERAKTVSSELPAQMLFTSGTSGDPKGVLLSHRNLISNTWAKLDAAPQNEQDLRLNILPFCHAYARTCELSTWVLSKSRLAIANDWNDFLRQAAELRPTLINLVPHLANKLLYHESTNRKLEPNEAVARLGGSVRLLQVGGAAISDELWHELANLGLPPLQGYGLTEASPVVCSNRSGQQRPGTIGPPVEGVELRIDASGQLWVRGAGVMLGYYGNPTATQERIQDGWLATGDLVERDELGHYRIVGRLSEFIVLSTGHKVSPEPIERRLQQCGYVERALLVGENQPFLAALIWPAWSSVPISLFTQESCNRRALNLVAFQEALEHWICQTLADLPEYSRPRKFIIISDSPDSSLITPKGSLRRIQAISWFRTQIDEAFKALANICSC